ncbi:VTT domain-containing protein [Candidatus Dojkabacteria bacterium]|jgi:membrane-associated protein|nr:VTT domain-containing protein [Candidatus Dojkabacteria bacterium]
MQTILNLFNIFLHIDKYLSLVIDKFGSFSYLIIFLVIFCETGLVITPFLPGDSFLFAAGALTASLGSFNIWLLWILLILAAFLGDTVNYWIGYKVGPVAFSGKVKFLKKEYLDRAQGFYEKYGGKAIILSRFIPIIRTFAPFVAGIGKMKYTKFISYNFIGGFVWVSLFLWVGYFFGNITFIKNNFEFVALGIIFISLIPIVVEAIKSKNEAKR